MDAMQNPPDSRSTESQDTPTVDNASFVADDSIAALSIPPSVDNAVKGSGNPVQSPQSAPGEGDTSGESGGPKIPSLLGPQIGPTLATSPTSEGAIAGSALPEGLSAPYSPAVSSPQLRSPRQAAQPTLYTEEKNMVAERVKNDDLRRAASHNRAQQQGGESTNISLSQPISDRPVADAEKVARTVPVSQGESVAESEDNLHGTESGKKDEEKVSKMSKIIASIVGFDVRTSDERVESTGSSSLHEWNTDMQERHHEETNAIASQRSSPDRGTRDNDRDTSTMPASQGRLNETGKTMGGETSQRGHDKQGVGTDEAAPTAEHPTDTSDETVQLTDDVRGLRVTGNTSSVVLGVTGDEEERASNIDEDIDGVEDYTSDAGSYMSFLSESEGELEEREEPLLPLEPPVDPVQAAQLEEDARVAEQLQREEYLEAFPDAQPEEAQIPGRHISEEETKAVREAAKKLQENQREFGQAAWRWNTKGVAEDNEKGPDDIGMGSPATPDDGVLDHETGEVIPPEDFYLAPEVSESEDWEVVDPEVGKGLHLDNAVMAKEEKQANSQTNHPAAGDQNVSPDTEVMGGNVEDGISDEEKKTDPVENATVSIEKSPTIVGDRTSKGDSSDEDSQ